MTNSELERPSETEPQLRSDTLFETFNSLVSIHKKINPWYRYDDEDMTLSWSDDEDHTLEARHEVAWNGAGQTLSLKSSLAEGTLVVDFFYPRSAYGSVTNETIRLRRQADDGSQEWLDATDTDITEFEAICLFMETALLNQLRKKKIQDTIARTTPLSEMLGQLETSEVSLFNAQDF